MSNSVYIVWEHFKSNYINQKDDEEEDDFEDEEVGEFDEESEGGLGNLLRVSRMLQPITMDAHFTPWGAFHPSNPMSPVNMYDLYFAHFHGFTTFTVKNFKDLMNRIEGVAIWAQHDPYTVIIGPAKTYSASEVKSNVESVLMGALGVPMKKANNKELEEMKAQSADMFKNGMNNLYLLFPNGSIDILENPSQADIKEAVELKTKIKDLILYMNGEIL